MSANEVLLHGHMVGREVMVRFKQAYVAAVAAQRYTFKFDGQEVLTAYAKYVVEYAELSLGVL